MISTSALHRRRLLQGASALGALALAPSAQAQATREPSMPGDGETTQKFSGDLTAFADEIVRLTPEAATQLGIDRGVYAPLKGELSDISPAGDAAWAAQVHAMHGRLAALDRTALPEIDRIRYDTVLYAADRGIDGLAFRFGGGAQAGFSGGAQPYVVTPAERRGHAGPGVPGLRPPDP